MKNNWYRIAICLLPLVALTAAGCGDKKEATVTTPPPAAAPPAGTAGANTQPGAKTSYPAAPEAAQYQQKAGGTAVAPNAR